MKRLDLSTIIKRLKYHRPLNAVDVLVDCKLPLELLGEGQFRYVFRISGTKYVLKLPKLGGIKHSAREIKALKLLTKDKFYAIHPYLPIFHFSNRNTGIILTDLATWDSYAKSHSTIKEIHEWCEDNGFIEADVSTDKHDNYGRVNGQLKILDLGCFVYGG